MASCMLSAILLLLILLPPQQCNARPVPHNTMKYLKEIDRRGGGGGEERLFTAPLKQINPSNQKRSNIDPFLVGRDAIRSKSFKYLLSKGSDTPPSGPSKRHNTIPIAAAAAAAP